MLLFLLLVQSGQEPGSVVVLTILSLTPSINLTQGGCRSSQVTANTNLRAGSHRDSFSSAPYPGAVFPILTSSFLMARVRISPPSHSLFAHLQQSGSLYDLLSMSKPFLAAVQKIGDKRCLSVIPAACSDQTLPFSLFSAPPFQGLAEMVDPQEDSCQSWCLL